MFFRKTKEETLADLGTQAEGLTEAQAEAQREKYGMNQLEEAKTKSVLMVFLSQFADLLVIILIAAAGISILTNNIESTLVILFVIIMNAVLGTVQHFKAEQSLKSLKELSAPLAKVIRDGSRKEIDAREIVVGDIILLEAGDIVPADGRIIQNYSMQVNESALTGESVAVNKFDQKIDLEDVSLGDQKNMVFSSSLVTYGRALVAITA
ncbi:MAG: HAD-IC family P-type ATPase, partial [Peptostreptococcaceae bacterium]|nr:HAD-IC family P-type ATPase [Peptostreptococcaceae bacterium]